MSNNIVNKGLALGLLLITINLTLLIASCAPIEVKVDYEKSTDFEKYKTYTWIPNEQPDLVNLPIEQEVLDKLIINAVNSELGKKGYSPETEHPDFSISYFLVTNAKTDVYMVNNYYSNIYPNIGYRADPYTSSSRESAKFRQTTYEQGILIIDIVDNQTKERIWRGHATSRVGVYQEADKREQRITTAIKKILSRFPPS